MVLSLITDKEDKFTYRFKDAYRFDHLNTLSEKFQTYTDQLPEAKVDNSQTTPFNPAMKVAEVEPMATKVDFGVYDLRSTNAASKNAALASTNSNFPQFIFFCSLLVE